MILPNDSDILTTSDACLGGDASTSQLHDAPHKQANSHPNSVQGVSLVTAEEQTWTFYEGRKYPVLSELLSVLMMCPELLALPFMILPFFAALGRVTMLAAREKLGKSTVAAFLIAKLSSGDELWDNWRLPPTRCLWVGLEEAKADAVRRFSDMGANCSNIRLLDQLPASAPLEQLAAEIHHFEAKVVVIDSLAALATSIDDENNAKGWTAFLRELTAIARKLDVAIVVLHHANKATGKYRGSSAIGAAMDMIIEMEATEESSPNRQFTARGRWPAEPFELTYRPQERSFDLTAGGMSAGDEQARTELESRIIDLVAAKRGTTKTAIREAIRGDKAKIDTALERLVGAGTLVRLGERGGYAVAATQCPTNVAAAADETPEVLQDPSLLALLP